MGPPLISDEIDGVTVASYLKPLRDRKWWVLGSLIVFVSLALLWSFAWATPTYRATAQVLRQSTAFDRALFDTQVFELADAQRELQTGSDLVRLDAVAAMAKKELDSTLDESALLAMVSVEARPGTDIINITAVSTEPSLAADVANAFATQFILFRQSAARAALNEAKMQVERQLATIPRNADTRERVSLLVSRSEELTILASMQTGGFEVIQPAKTPTVPSSPRPIRNVLLALIVGAIMGIALAFMVNRLDRRLKTTEAVEGAFGLPVLATVPKIKRDLLFEESPVSDVFGFSDTSLPFVESFRTLQSSLKYFELDDRIRTILITSALPKEGKTITTVNLALSLALSGASVVVLEGDLRRPMLHRYLHLRNRTGVTDVLTGGRQWRDAGQEVKVESSSPFRKTPKAERSSPQSTQRGFYCLTSGPLPPDASVLIGSQQMKHLLEEVSAWADYVLIDTPPALVVADSLSLVNIVDAVIVCARINRSTYDEAHQLRKLLQRSQARTLGVVAGGAKIKGQGRYGAYGYHMEESASLAVLGGNASTTRGPVRH